jgi:heptosyltransferase-2
VDDILLYERPGMHEGIAGLWRLTTTLRSMNFGAAILLQNAIEAAIIACMAGIPVRAGYNSDGRGFLLTHAVKRTKSVLALHQTDYYLEMTKALGCRQAGRDALLHPGKDDRVLGDALLARHGLQNADLIVGMAPGASYGPAKKWFPERFARVADRLAESFHARVILFGSADDAASIAEVRHYAEHPPPSLTGMTTLREAMAVIARCRLFISNDSGLMHVAAALGVPTIAVFGSTNPATTSPPGRRNRIIYKNVPCSPCLKTDCPTDFKCMHLIEADEVYHAAAAILADI